MKKKIVSIASFVLAFLLSIPQTKAQSLYDLNTIQKIEITFLQPNWDYQMDTAKIGADGYLMASQVIVNGTVFDSVGVKYKGNSSYDSTAIKNPLHIALDEFKSQKYKGFTSIKLGNNIKDPSMIREVLAYTILKNYMHCPRSNFAQVYINGNYIGLFANDESIDKKFYGDHFYSSTNATIKCNPTITPGPSTKSNLKYVNTDSASYTNFYELKSKTYWSDVIPLLDTVTNYPSNVGSAMDLDRACWMLAFNNAFVNLDSYSGVFAQNYYLYKDNTQHFNPIVWDLNMCFGGFPFVGAGGTSFGALTTTGLQQMSPTIHATDSYWPLLNAIYNETTYKKMYIAHLKTLITEQISNGAYQTLATQLQSIVDTAVNSDQNKFYSYAQFQNGMTGDVNIGTYTVPGISNLMNARLSYLLSTPEFTANAPTISLVYTSTTAPAFNSSVTFRADVTNASPTSVYLGYRFNKTKKFQRILMYDDGAHNDGAANDNKFGCDVIMNSGNIQYYVYAENMDAGIFSPVRAEHEFYELNAVSSNPVAGELVINEVLAQNSNGVKDEYGTKEDWIELYNNSNKLLSLSNLYLSNDKTNLLKWRFPLQTTINPNDYIIVWADDDSSQQIYHTNFNLSKDSGNVLLSDASAQILDSISFSNQVADVSFGRFPNGTGSFISMNPSFSSYNGNYPIQTILFEKSNLLTLYPNPTSQSAMLEFEGTKSIEVSTICGQKILSVNATKKYTLNTSNWKNGLYLVKCGNGYAKLIVNHY